MRFETYLDVIKKKLAYFHYHLKCQNITDTEGDIEIDLMKSNQNTVFTYNLLKCCQFDDNRRDLILICNVIKKKLAYFHYHLKCQNITDTEGDIEIDLMKSNQNTVFTYN